MVKIIVLLKVAAETLGPPLWIINDMSNSVLNGLMMPLVYYDYGLFGVTCWLALEEKNPAFA